MTVAPKIGASFVNQYRQHLEGFVRGTSNHQKTDDEGLRHKPFYMYEVNNIDILQQHVGKQDRAMEESENWL
jgi:hypothetical protein